MHTPPLTLSPQTKYKPFFVKLKTQHQDMTESPMYYYVNLRTMRSTTSVNYTQRVCILDNYQHAQILLFPKSNKDRTNPDNYRPISLTCTTSKLLQKIIVNRIDKHLLHLLVPNIQAGFRPGLSTKHQLMRVITPLEHAFHKRFTPVLVALDIQKAFDTMEFVTSCLGYPYQQLSHAGFPASFTKEQAKLIYSTHFHIT